MQPELEDVTVPVYKETICKSVLSRSRIADIDYSINPYVGCEHGCAYCYARFMGRKRGHREEWGGFVDIKVNAPQVLSREIARSKRGTILLSSVTDPYQPIERRYQLTRKILKRLLRYDYPISILTKSTLVERDIDLLRHFKHCQVGVTVVALDEEVGRAFEPHSPPPKNRFNALRRVAKNNIQTYVFLGPLLPKFSEEDLEEMLDECEKVGVHHVLIDKLNMRQGNWQSITKVLDTEFPERKEEWKNAFVRKGYYEGLKNRIEVLAAERGIPLISCF